MIKTCTVSKRYQTSVFAQLSITLLENENSDLIHPIFKTQKPPGKITRYGVHLPKEDVLSYFVS